MKKVLFATTALVASAGIAAAGEIDFAATGGAGVASEAGADAFIYGFAELDVLMSGEADNGLTFGAKIDIDAGRKYDIGDFEDDGTKGGVGFGDFWLAFGGAKLSFDDDGKDDLYDDGVSDDHDIQFDFSKAGFMMSLTMDAEAAASEFSYKLAYTTGGFTGTLTGNDLADNMELHLMYAMNNYSFFVAHDFLPAETTIGGSATFNAVTVGAEFNIDNDDWEISVAYAENGLSIAASTDQDDEWELAGSYDLGGGLSAVAGVKYDDSFYLGVAASF